MIEFKTLNNQLLSLRSAFDKAIMSGNSFEEVKKMYKQIKELEQQIAVREFELLKDGRIEE